MKVCMITTSFPLFSGDYSGLFVFRLCSALVSLNLKIDVVAPAHNNTLAFEIMDGCRVNRFQYFSPKKLQVLAYGPGGIPANLKCRPWLACLLPFFVGMFAIKALHVSKEADLIHAQWLYSGIIARILKKIRGIPYVITLRGSDVLIARKAKHSARLAAWVLKGASAITTVNQEMKDWVTAQGISSEIVSVIRNGVALQGLRKKKADDAICRFIFVGSLVPGKGVHYLVQAFASVYAFEKNIRLFIVGDGVEAEDLKAEVRKNGLSDAVVFSGIKGSDEIPGFMRQADCLVLPSLSEGIPNVILEAMACALPVIASDLPGIREVVEDKETGLLVAARDVEGLAKNLCALAQNPEQREKMGAAAYRHLSEMNLSWEKTAKQYLEVYETVCAVSQVSSI